MALAYSHAILGRCTVLPMRERIGAPVAVLIFLFFFGVGIDAIFRPKRHMNTCLRASGEMLRELNEIGVQFSGLAFSCFSGWMLYELIRSVWNECFR
jgi:hypothetical protein